ncbi:hypothetical protein L1887_00084 [Cichorium endivia]|nr:hypothetical protein L1887_00084 [Cichorium endivia]
MGCGKSKHAVVTATTIVKSTKSDDGKETRTTKTVTEKGDTISVQQVETTSSVVEDTKTETTTTKRDPIGTVSVGASVAPTLTDKEVAKEDEKVNDAAPIDDVDDVKGVKEDEEVKDSNPTNTNDVVPTLDEGVIEDVKEDGKKKESTTTDEKEAKIENVAPTLMENVMESTLVVKDNKKLKEFKEDTTYETPMKTTEEFPNTEFATPKVQEQKDVAPTKESIKVETKKEEDVKVSGADIAKTETLTATEPQKAPTAVEANAAETKEKET